MMRSSIFGAVCGAAILACASTANAQTPAACSPSEFVDAGPFAVSRCAGDTAVQTVANLPGVVLFQPGAANVRFAIRPAAGGPQPPVAAQDGGAPPAVDATETPFMIVTLPVTGGRIGRVLAVNGDALHPLMLLALPGIPTAIASTQPGSLFGSKLRYGSAGSNVTFTLVDSANARVDVTTPWSTGSTSFALASPSISAFDVKLTATNATAFSGSYAAGKITLAQSAPVTLGALPISISGSTLVADLAQSFALKGEGDIAFVVPESLGRGTLNLHGTVDGTDALRLACGATSSVPVAQQTVSTYGPALGEFANLAVHLTSLSAQCDGAAFKGLALAGDVAIPAFLNSPAQFALTVVDNAGKPSLSGGATISSVSSPTLLGFPVTLTNTKLTFQNGFSLDTDLAFVLPRPFDTLAYSTRAIVSLPAATADGPPTLTLRTADARCSAASKPVKGVSSDTLPAPGDGSLSLLCENGNINGVSYNGKLSLPSPFTNTFNNVALTFRPNNGAFVGTAALTPQTGNAIAFKFGDVVDASARSLDLKVQRDATEMTANQARLGFSAPWLNPKDKDDLVFTSLGYRFGSNAQFTTVNLDTVNTTVRLLGMVAHFGMHSDKARMRCTTATAAAFNADQQVLSLCGQLTLPNHLRTTNRNPTIDSGSHGDFVNTDAPGELIAFDFDNLQLGPQGIGLSTFNVTPTKTCLATAGQSEKYDQTGYRLLFFDVCFNEGAFSLRKNATAGLQWDFAGRMSIVKWIKHDNEIDFHGGFKNDTLAIEANMRGINARIGPGNLEMTTLSIYLDSSTRRISGQVGFIDKAAQDCTVCFRDLGVEQHLAKNNQWKTKLIFSPDYGKTGTSLALRYGGDLLALLTARWTKLIGR